MVTNNSDFIPFDDILELVDDGSSSELEQDLEENLKFKSKRKVRLPSFTLQLYLPAQSAGVFKDSEFTNALIIS